MTTQATNPTIPVIESTHELSLHQFDNRYYIYCADPYNYVEPSQDKIEKLAKDLKAVDATIVKVTSRQESAIYTYLTAKKFGSLDARLKEAFKKEDYFCNKVVNDKTTIYLLRIPSKKFYCGYPLEFWHEDESNKLEDYWGEIAFKKVD